MNPFLSQIEAANNPGTRYSPIQHYRLAEYWLAVADDLGGDDCEGALLTALVHAVLAIDDITIHQ